MTEQVETIRLEVNEKPALESTARANAAMDSVEKKTAQVSASSTKAVSDSARAVGTVTAGSRTTFERLVEASSKAIQSTAQGASTALSKIQEVSQSTAQAAEAVHSVILNTLKTLAVFEAYILSSTVALVAHNSAVFTLSNTYRILRLSITPTLFTAVSLAVVFAAEEMVKLAYATGKLSEAQAFSSERTGIQINDLQKLAAANKELQKGPGFLEGITLAITANQELDSFKKALATLGVSGKGTSVQELRDIAVAFDDVTNPIDRARLAVQLFGTDAEKYLPVLNSKLDDTITKIDLLGSTLGEKATRDMAEFRANVDGIGNTVLEFGKKVGMTLGGPITAFLAAINDPGFKAMMAKGGLAIGNVGLSMVAPIFEGPRHIKTAEEREQLRQASLSDEQFTDEFNKGAAKNLPANNNFFNDKRKEQIADLESRQKALQGYTDKTPELRNRLAEITSQLVSLRAQEAGGAGVIDSILFGGKPPKLVDDYRNSLDGLNSKLGVLKTQRSTIIDGYDKQTGAQKMMDLASLQGINTSIAATEKQIATFDKKGKADTTIQDNEAKAAAQLVDARKHEFTGLAEIVQTYYEYVKLLGTSRQANLDLSKAVQIRLRSETEKEQRKSAAENIKSTQEVAAAELSFATQRFQKEQTYAEETARIRYATVDSVFDHEKTVAQQTHDLQMQALTELDNDTLRDKLTLESAKLEVAKQYSSKIAILDIEQLNRHSELAIGLLQTELDNKIISEEKFVERRDALLNQSGQQAKRIAADSAAEIELAQATSAHRSLQLIEDNAKTVYDTIKQSASGIFDQLFTKSQNIFQAIGNVFKTAMLTALKEVVTSRIAASFTGLLTGSKTSFSSDQPGIIGSISKLMGINPSFSGGRGSVSKLEMSNHIGDSQLVNGALPVYVTGSLTQPDLAGAAGAAVGTGGGAIASLTSLLGLGMAGLAGGRTLGSGASAVASTIYSSSGAIIAQPTFASGTAGTIGSDGASGVTGGVGGVKGMLGNITGMFGSLKSGLTSLGQLGATVKAFGGGIYGAKGGALLVGGGILAADGLRRGGMVGLGEDTAGGALIGAKFGGLPGAAIGAGIGALAGVVRLFIKGAREKAIEKVKDSYGITISKQMADQIVAVAKSNFGGDLNVAIRSAQVRELIQLYAMTTGQGISGIGAVKQQSLGLIESGGNVYQNPSLQNGVALPGLSGSIPSLGISGTGQQAAGAQPYSIQITATDSQVHDFMTTKTLEIVQANPRTIAAATYAGAQTNTARRETASALLEPGVLVT